MSQGLLRKLEGMTSNMRMALVGGVVRDWLLHRMHRDPWNGLRDLDLSIETQTVSKFNVSCLAQELSNYYYREVTLCQYYEQYGSVEMNISGISIDLTTARQEYYPSPGFNPIVDFNTLESDLARRDLSLNAMALVFEKGHWELLDLHGGQSDLAMGWLEFLSETSVADDPTRLVRAARYGAKFGMILGPNSFKQATTTTALWPWSWRLGDPFEKAPPSLSTRLRMELESLLECKGWDSALQLLQKWGALKLLDLNLLSNNNWRLRIVWGERLGLPPLLALITIANNPIDLACRLQIPKNQIHWLKEFIEFHQFLIGIRTKNSFSKIPISQWPPSRWCRELEGRGWAPETIVLGLISGIQPRKPLLRWYLRWRHINSPITAGELIQKGVTIGPDLGNYLRLLRWNWVDIKE
uniref:tRNA nucleotidyltransferase/poly(A) polymerase n=1 Tax=Paulinella chromatophora TaxID=39717 RepID=B1X4P7_PAUCH|nr:tRNA nucleotidyltransferase/poly(A) polymerase [Paulinella chromatophora]ACB42916.1 tRNA nucleotidyltransferase/poly(A) polymerase [Paulinella chromatophora]